MDRDRELQGYFKFDEADLFANRSGHLTLKQQERLAKDEKVWNVVSLIWGVFILAVAIGPIIAIGFAARPCLSHASSGCEALLIVFAVGFGLIWLPIWGYSGFRTIRKAVSAQNVFSLEKVEGPVNIIKVESYNSSLRRNEEEYELHVGGEEFDCDSDLADIMLQKDIYAIYFIKDPKEILSAEFIAEAKGTK